MSVYESYQGEAGQWEANQYEDENSYENTFETWETSQGEQESSLGAELNEILGEMVGEGPFSEVQEMELANELLEISSEQELEDFLGKLVRGAGRLAGSALKGPLKGILKTVLPVAAGALGNLIVPGAGGLIGSKLGTMATKLFEVEMESMDEQEAQFEVARRFVRLAGTAAAQATQAPRGVPPQAVARAALITAARRQAPGLVPVLQSTRGGRPGPGHRPARRRGPRPGHAYGTYGSPPYPVQSTGDTPVYADAGAGDGATSAGRWVRQGRKIIIYGA